MARRLPSLNALRAFEAAGRHMSMRKAAAELNVTPAAVSHQVKALEEYLGVPLFRRLNRALLLTSAAQKCLPGLTEGLDRLAEAMERLAGEDRAGIVTVSLPPSFAAKWLVPRLERFTETHPDLDVRVSASMELVDFRRDEVDIAVRFGHGNYPGLIAEKLFDDAVAPMCAPALLVGNHPLRQPGDLRHHALLHDDSALIIDATAPDWRMWLKAAGVEGVDASRGSHFSSADHAILAAIDGAGVTLGRLSLAAADLAAGRLVMPFELSLALAPSYYVVYPEATADRPKVTAFRDWLMEEAVKDGTRRQADEGASAD